jgi:hypothetical protein
MHFYEMHYVATKFIGWLLTATQLAAIFSAWHEERVEFM